MQPLFSENYAIFRVDNYTLITQISNIHLRKSVLVWTQVIPEAHLVRSIFVDSGNKNSERLLSYTCHTEFGSLHSCEFRSICSVTGNYLVCDA